MNIALADRLTLGGAGAVALAIGAMIALAPEEFYAGYGIAPPAGPAMLSELRAPGAALAAAGAAILAGAWRAGMVRIAATLGAGLYGAFACGRLLGLALDGAPGESVLAAMAVEIGLCGLCLLRLLRLVRQGRGAGRDAGAGGGAGRGAGGGAPVAA